MAPTCRSSQVVSRRPRADVRRPRRRQEHSGARASSSARRRRGGARLRADARDDQHHGARPRAAACGDAAGSGRPGVTQFRFLARELGIWLHIGSLALMVSGGKLANRSLLISPDGAIAARYDKIHMFDVDLGGGETYRGERQLRARARRRSSPTCRGAARHDDLLRPALSAPVPGAGQGGRHVSWPFRPRLRKPTGIAHWHTLLRARAIECQCYVFAAAQGGKHENGRETFGHSLVVSPWGEVLAEADIQPAVIFADVELQRLEDVRRQVPSLQARSAISTWYMRQIRRQKRSRRDQVPPAMREWPRIRGLVRLERVVRLPGRICDSSPAPSATAARSASRSWRRTSPRRARRSRHRRRADAELPQPRARGCARHVHALEDVGAASPRRPARSTIARSSSGRSVERLRGRGAGPGRGGRGDHGAAPAARGYELNPARASVLRQDDDV